MTGRVKTRIDAHRLKALCVCINGSRYKVAETMYLFHIINFKVEQQMLLGDRLQASQAEVNQDGQEAWGLACLSL